MNIAVTPLACAVCEQLQIEYERGTAVRTQAEADFLAAAHTRDSVAIAKAAQLLEAALKAWDLAYAALRGHQKNHILTQRYPISCAQKARSR